MIRPSAAHTVLVGLTLLSAVACSKPKPSAPAAPIEAHTSPTPVVAPTQPVAALGLPNFAPLVERVRPAVVNIYTTSRTRNTSPSPLVPFAPKDRVAQSLGSGFIISAEGLVLTNFHVIQKATDIEVRLLDNRRFKAKVVGKDPKTDVALLQLQGAKDLPSLELAASKDLKIGEWLIAIGNPLGLTSTVTAGIASATGRRNVPMSGDMMYQDFIQTDASINPGNSGGPLINSRGRVVGINTAVSAEGQGIGFAIPSDMVQQILPQLQQNGSVQRSWLGIYVAEVPDVVRTQLGVPNGGALVRRVVDDGPAKRAKLRSGDILVKFDGKLIEDSSRLSWMASMKGAGKKVPIEFYRGTQRMGTYLVMGTLPD